MDNDSMDALFVRVFIQERKIIMDMGGSKYKGRYKSRGKGIRKCWKCGRVRHYKKDYKSKNVDQILIWYQIVLR